MLLKKAIGNYWIETELPTGLECDAHIEEAIWEEEFAMCIQFLAIRLENKYVSQGGSNDRVSDEKYEGDDVSSQSYGTPKVYRVFVRKTERKVS